MTSILIRSSLRRSALPVRFYLMYRTKGRAVFNGKVVTAAVRPPAITVKCRYTGNMKELPQSAGLASKLCADRLKALGDQDRLRIVQALRGGQKHVSQLAEELDEDLANISHHLQILRRCGILKTERQGRFVLYSIHPDVFPAERETGEHLDLGCCRLELPKSK